MLTNSGMAPDNRVDSVGLSWQDTRPALPSSHMSGGSMGGEDLSSSFPLD